VELGQTVGKSSERAEYTAALDEDMTPYKLDELAADRHSMECVPSRVRGLLAFGAIWFLQMINYYEALLVRFSYNHPFAVNRMQTLLDLYGPGMNDGERRLAKGFIETGRTTFTTGQRFSNLAADERVEMFFGGRKPAFAADFIEWFLPFALNFVSERGGIAS
jgi:hypothetical protein